MAAFETSLAPVSLSPIIMEAVSLGADQQQITTFLLPVQANNHPIYNPSLDYSVYLSQPFFFVLFQVLILLTTVYTVGIEIKFRTATDWLATAKGNMVTAVLGKLLPYTFIYILIGWLGNYVMFGILHFLGVSMMLFGLGQKLFDLLPSWVGIGVCVLLFILTMNVRLTYANGMISPGYIGIPNLFAIKLPMEAYNVGVLFPLGLHNASFSSSDYFPMMPWFFLFLAGSYFGIIAKAGRLPKFCYPTHIKWLAAVGRYTIWIYVLHQPVLYGIFSLIFHR